MLTNEDKQWLAEHLAATEAKFTAEMQVGLAGLELKFSAEIRQAKNDMIQVSRDGLAATEAKFSAEIQQAKNDMIQVSRDGLVAMEAKVSEDILHAKNDMIQVSRDMQTEVIRYMGNLAEQFSVRMRHVEANASNLDTAERLRLAALEDRFLRLEKKVLGETP